MAHVREPRICRAVIVAALLFVHVSVWVAPHAPAHAQGFTGPAEPLTPDAWAALGPTGPGVVTSVGVSTGWPEDRFLLVARRVADWASETPTRAHPAHAARSYDGGQTWEPLPETPSENVITVIQTAAYGRVAFTLPSSSSGGTRVLSRSIDDGQTWEVVQPTSATYARGLSRLLVSPDVYRDNRLLLAGDGHLRQSTDAGATWTMLDPAPGQIIQNAIFSPDFANDQTLYAFATAGDYPDVVLPKDAEPAVIATISERSAGVTVSTDAGATWRTVSAGLEADGGSFRLVQALAISPTFAQDGTLFAFGWETYSIPIWDGRPYATVRRALFRSRDRGESWQVIMPPGRKIDKVQSGTERARAALALAPDFAQSGRVLMTLNSTVGSPGSSNCNLYWSADGGDTWETRNEVSSYGGCSGLRIGGQDAQMAVWSTSSNGGGGWRMTTDGGARWMRLPHVYNNPGSNSQVAVARDGTLFLGGLSGVWAIGPSAVRAEGRLPCSHSDGEAFAAIARTATIVRQRLGCAVSEPYLVLVRERRLAEDRDLWLEDEGAVWYSLQPVDYIPIVQGQRVRRVNKQDSPWPGPPDRTVQATAQRFEGGVIVRLPEPDGSRTAFVVAGPVWQAVADEQAP